MERREGVQNGIPHGSRSHGCLASGRNVGGARTRIEGGFHGTLE
jgi:hypothetical protein